MSACDEKRFPTNKMLIMGFFSVFPFEHKVEAIKNDREAGDVAKFIGADPIQYAEEVVEEEAHEGSALEG